MKTNPARRRRREAEKVKIHQKTCSLHSFNTIASTIAPHSPFILRQKKSDARYVHCCTSTRSSNIPSYICQPSRWRIFSNLLLLLLLLQLAIHSVPVFFPKMGRHQRSRIELQKGTFFQLFLKTRSVPSSTFPPTRQ